MRKRSKKIAAALLSAVLMLQSGWGNINAVGTPVLQAEEQNAVEETSVESADAGIAAVSETVPETQAATEAQTQAATEAQTQAATEAQTQAPTEAQTQAVTEAQTQAATEMQTDAEETERSERVNDGEKRKASDLVASLKAALPYLMVAETVTVPEDMEDLLGLNEEEVSSDDELILQGADGVAVTAGLEKFSVKLANGKSSSDVEVINLYADEDGKLDTAQLNEQFGDQVIDVTKKYFVVNVIADHADQDLKFAGYDMILSGKAVEYKEETQPGDILYNFAAMDGEEFTAYKGTVTLTSNLQGTFLAPEAEVKVEDDLAGAVFARTITVADSVEELLHIVFVDGKSAEQTEESDGMTEEAAQEETEAAADAASSEAETEAATDEVSSETTTGSENDTTEAIEEVLDMVIEGVVETGTWYSQEGITMNVLLNDENNSDTNLLASMKVEIRAAKDISAADGTVVYEKDALVKSQEYTAETAVDLGAGLQYSGIYYLDVTEKIENGTAKYLDTSRIYFEIDENGEVVFNSEGDASWDDAANQLVITLTQAEQQLPATSKYLTVSVVDNNGGQISSAAFVIKDGNHRLLVDTEGCPLYYVDYAGTKTVLRLNQLTEGTYYLSQIRTAEGYLIDTMDKEFQIEGGIAFFEKTVDETEGESIIQELTVVNNPVSQNAGTLTVTARTYYNDVLLTSEQKNPHYVALFSDEALTNRVSEIQTLEYEAGTAESKAVTFAGLAQDTTQEVVYYLAGTDEYGTVVPISDVQSVPVSYKVWNGETDSNKIVFQATSEQTPQREQKTARVDFYLDAEDAANEWKTGYSYPVEVTVTKKVLDQAGAETPSSETFYFNIYQVTAENDGLGDPVFASPTAISMNGAASASATVQIKMNAVSGDFAIREVDANGTILTTDTKDFQYAVSYPENPNGKFTASCTSAKNETDQATGVAAPVKLTIENRNTNSLVKIQAEDASTGELLSGITLVIKNKSGKVVLINGKETLTSGKTAIELENVLTSGQTYYLSALQASSGYAVAPDVAFTVNKSGETVVSLQYSALSEDSGYKLTVSKQVYSGKYPVYAYDTTNGTYAAKGAYTFYVALFADSARTQKVSDVQKVTVTGLGSTTVFKNLEKGQTYYVGETDQYGQLKKSTIGLSVKYASKGVVTMSEKSKTTVIQNSYSSLPEGYRYTGTLTLTKKVTNTSGNASKVTETFYAGIYRTADYSDTPTVVKLDLKDASSASVKRRILLSGTKDMVYYIAEVDADGNRITDDSDFTYTVSIDNPTVTVAKGANATATITNKTKATKATLYITKKVYNGTAQQTVNETFYAGLFKDPQFTKAYTKPIAMKLEGKSELTLKLSLNLGTSSSTKIYIAEVDADGNVIKDEKSFGYEIKMVNSTAEFTQDRREIQTIILNSVYGTTTTSDWNTVLSSDGNDISSMDGGYWGVSGNGDISDSTAAQTGDETPVLTYVSLMCAALFVLAGGFLRRRRATK